MSEVVLTHQASPGALGAGLSAFFFANSGTPSYVGNDGIVYGLVAQSNTGDQAVSGNLSVNGSALFNGPIRVDFTNEATVGNVTINKPAGRCIAAANAPVVVVTNNRCAATSQVFAMPNQNDSTGRVTAVVAQNGCFTVHLTPPTANMQINFLVINP